ncbi:MAG: GC-type dockerin domain-anchored protein [Phycisphaerales bacterium]
MNQVQSKWLRAGCVLASAMLASSASGQLVQFGRREELEPFVQRTPSCWYHSATVVNSNISVQAVVHLDGLEISTPPEAELTNPLGYARAIADFAGETNFPVVGTCAGTDYFPCFLIGFAGSTREANPSSSTVAFGSLGSLDVTASVPRSSPGAFELSAGDIAIISGTAALPLAAPLFGGIAITGAGDAPKSFCASTTPPSWVDVLPDIAVAGRAQVNSSGITLDTNGTLLNAAGLWRYSAYNDHPATSFHYVGWLLGNGYADGRFHTDLAGTATSGDFVELTIILTKDVGSDRSSGGSGGGSCPNGEVFSTATDAAAFATGNFIRIGVASPTVGVSGSYRFSNSTALSTETNTLQSGWLVSDTTDATNCPSVVRTLVYRIPLAAGHFEMDLSTLSIGMLGHDPDRDANNTSHGLIEPITCDDLVKLVDLVTNSQYSPNFDMDADGDLDSNDITLLTQLIAQTRVVLSGPPSSPTSLDPLGDDNDWYSVTPANSGVTWYSFTSPDFAPPANTNFNSRAFLDFDTEGSTVSNTALALFDSAGNLVASDTLDGTGSLAQLTFGFSAGRASPGGDALAYNGRDGAALTASATYYLAVVVEPGSSSVGFGTPWGIQLQRSCDSPSGSVTLRYRNGWIAVPSLPSPRTDLGKVYSANSPKATGDLAITSTPTVKRFQWVHFRSVLPTNASDYYLDIHTLGSSLPDLGRGANDTEMAIFNKQGDKIAENDDYDNGSTTIRQSVLSWGLTSSARSYGSGAATGVAGGNGDVLPAGDYYVAVGQHDLTFDQDFAVTGANTNDGTVKLTVVTNIVNPACNDADVASLGGSPVPDGILTTDDLIYFLAQFFANNVSVADLVGLGGAPSLPDSAITADDLVYFLAVFFAACGS